MATLSAYIAWVVTTWTMFGDWQVPLWLATIAGMVFGFALGAATEVFIVRPLARKSPLAVFVALIAVFLGINAFDARAWGAPPQETIGSLFPSEPDDFVRLLGTVWRWDDIGTLVADARSSTACCSCCSARPRSAWRCGRSPATPSRASSSASRPSWILAGSWGLAGALAALAGVARRRRRRRRSTPMLMFTIFVYASAAATLGGLDSPLGAVVAGLGIGVVENVAAELAPDWIGQEMKLSVAVLCIFVVLLVRPSGLFGTAKVERV